MLGLGSSTSRSAFRKELLTYVRDGLKLYMPFRGADTVNKGVQFVGTDSASFDGTNDYILCGNGTSLDITDAITIMAWVKPSGTGQTAHIAGRDDGSAQSYSLNINGSNQYEFVFYVSGSAKKVNSSTADTSDVWVHLAGTYDKKENILYVNGVAEDTDTDSTTAIDNDDVQFSIGARGDFGNDFKGRIKNVAIWNRALTATEIQNVQHLTYEKIGGRLLSGMVSWWPINESQIAAVTKIDDLKGTNSGTVTGVTLSAAGSGSVYGSTTPMIPRSIENASTVQADAIGAGSASLDGTDDYIAGVGNCPTGDWTVTGWMNRDANGTGALYSANFDLMVRETSSGKVQLFVGDSGKHELTDAVVLTLNVWNHVAGTWDGSNAKIYVDGVLKASSTTGTLANSSATAASLGAYTDGSQNLINGNICQVGLWSAALTQAQIQSIMEKTYEELIASEKTNLVSYWALDELIEGSGGNFAVYDKVDETLGSELVPNGTMEVDDNWNDQGSPTSNVQSAEQANTGTYSRKFVTDSGGDGIKSDTFTLTAGKVYRVEAYLYIVTGSAGGGFLMRLQDGGGGDVGGSFHETARDTWEKTTFFILATSSGSDAYFRVYQNGSGTSTVYVDDVSVKEVGGNAGVLV